MKLDRSGPAGAGPSSLPAADLPEKSSPAPGRKRHAQQDVSISRPLKRPGASRSPSPAAPDRAGPAAEPMSAEAPEAPEYRFTDMPADVLLNIRGKLHHGDAASLVDINDTFRAIFQPRVVADTLVQRTRNPGGGAILPWTDRELNRYFRELVTQANALPETLRVPVLKEILEGASRCMNAESTAIEYVCDRYMQAASEMLDRESRYELLRKFAEMLEGPKFRRQCVDPAAPDTPRPSVVLLARRFDSNCVVLANEARSLVRFHNENPQAAAYWEQSRNARLRWAEHTAMHPDALVAVCRLRSAGLFMVPSDQRARCWHMFCGDYKKHAKLPRTPLLQALCAATTTLGTTDDCERAIRYTIESLTQADDAQTRAMAIGFLTDAVRGSADYTLKYGSIVFLLAAVNTLPPEYRPRLQASLIEALPPAQGPVMERAADCVLSQVAELRGDALARMLTALVGMLRAIPPSEMRLVVFDRIWKALPAIDARCRESVRQNLAQLIFTLPSQVQPQRLSQAVDDAADMSGAELAAFLPCLLSNLARLDSKAAAITGFCDAAAVAGRLPIEEQAGPLGKLYESVTGISDLTSIYPLLTLLDRAAARLPERDRVVLIGLAADKASVLPLTQRDDYFHGLAARADALMAPMREEAYSNIVRPIAANLGHVPGGARNLRIIDFYGAVSRIPHMPLKMRGPLLASALIATTRQEDLRGDVGINAAIKRAVSKLPPASRTALREALEAANCTHLLGTLYL
jgi:hypothetical protein